MRLRLQYLENQFIHNILPIHSYYNQEAILPTCMQNACITMLLDLWRPTGGKPRKKNLIGTFMGMLLAAMQAMQARLLAIAMYLLYWWGNKKEMFYQEVPSDQIILCNVAGQIEVEKILPIMSLIELCITNIDCNFFVLHALRYN